MTPLPSRWPFKIQTQLLRDAVAKGRDEARDRSLGELEVGVRECYADVRELLVHFRTRTSAEDIEAALRATLSKFEHQTGIATSLSMTGQACCWRPMCRSRCCTWCRRRCPTCASTRVPGMCSCAWAPPLALRGQRRRLRLRPRRRGAGLAACGPGHHARARPAGPGAGPCPLPPRRGHARADRAAAVGLGRGAGAGLPSNA